MSWITEELSGIDLGGQSLDVLTSGRIGVYLGWIVPLRV